MDRFILKPRFNNLCKYRLHYKDILTYISIRSFYNSKDKYCYPSYATIAKLSGLSKKFIGESIKRLKLAGLLEVWKIGKFQVKHCYKFDETRELQKVPYELLATRELTTTEKCMLLMMAELGGSLMAYEDVIETLSLNSGPVKKTIGTHVKSLILKGYLAEDLVENPLDNTLTKTLKVTDKLNWSFGFIPAVDSLKAKESQTESWAMSVVDFATKMFKSDSHQEKR